MKKVALTIYSFDELEPDAQRQAVDLERERIREQLDGIISTSIESIMVKHGLSFDEAGWDEEGFTFKWLPVEEAITSLCRRFTGREPALSGEAVEISFDGAKCAVLVSSGIPLAVEFVEDVTAAVNKAVAEVVAMLEHDVPYHYGAEYLADNIEAAGMMFYQDGTHFMPPDGVELEVIS
jgi:hypothetical protein